MRLNRMASTLGAAAATLAASLVVGQTVAGDGGANRAKIRMPAVSSCEDLVSPALARRIGNLLFASAEIKSAAVVPATGTVPEFCRVNLTINNPSSDDQVNVVVCLPVAGWNGRFQGTGGGGYSGGGTCQNGAISAGYATASTDTGHVGNDGTFALNPDGSLNWQLIKDFAYLGIHEMTVSAKAVVAAYYGRPARYSYWNGCSTGGRQGLAEAQRYPRDYDGILAGAPAINWDDFIPSMMWAQVVMNNEQNFVPRCKFRAFTDAAIHACDKRDGVTDGVIDDPRSCDFDPRTLIGNVTECGVITAADADVVRKVWDGPRDRRGRFLWYGLAMGTPLAEPNGMAEVNLNPDGTVQTASAIRYAIWHIGWWVLQDPAFNWQTVTYDLFRDYLRRSIRQYGDVMGTDNPDLGGFRHAGGKVLMWHGFADPRIFPEGTIDYYERVIDAMGGGRKGARKTNDFARLFMAPGVGHCGGGVGPQVSNADLFQAVVDWVENDKAPERLIASIRQGTEVVRTRPWCLYPKVAVYRGTGSTDDEANFDCKEPKEKKGGHGHHHR
jgi:feruloyl esterase